MYEFALHQWGMQPEDINEKWTLTRLIAFLDCAIEREKRKYGTDEKEKGNTMVIDDEVRQKAKEFEESKKGRSELVDTLEGIPGVGVSVK